MTTATSNEMLNHALLNLLGQRGLRPLAHTIGRKR